MISCVRLIRQCSQSQGLIFSCLCTYCERHHSTLPTTSSSPAVLYLQKSCGLSLDSSMSVPKGIRNVPSETIDRVIHLLRVYGLSNSQITELVSVRPKLLLVDPDKTLKRNLELLASMDITGTALAKTLMKKPNMLESEGNKVVEFFKGYGFNNEQTSALTRKNPELYTRNLHKNLRPKLEFLKSLGFTDNEVRKLFAADPFILRSSLENQIIPSINVLRQYLGEDETIVKAIKRSAWILKMNVTKSFERNMMIMNNHGVPSSLIKKMFVYHPPSLLSTEENLNKVLAEVPKLGLEPTNFQFVQAVRVMLAVSEERWQHKLKLYRSYGVSDEELRMGIRLQPFSMLLSEQKIAEKMDFYVKRLKMDTSFFSKYPVIVQISLNKRILPRCAVIQILAAKKVAKAFNLARVINLTEKKFVSEVIDKYKHDVPDILKAHRGEIEFEGFPDGFTF